MLRVKLKTIGDNLLYLSVLAIAFSDFNVLDTSELRLSLPQIFSVVFLALIFLTAISAKKNSLLLKSKESVLTLIGIIFFFTVEFIATLFIDGGGGAFQVFKSRVLSLSLLLVMIHCFGLSEHRKSKIFSIYVVPVCVIALSIVLVGSNVLFFEFGRFEHLHLINILGVNFVRNAGLLYNYGDVAIMFSFVTPYLIYSIIRSKKIERLIALALLALVVLAAFITLSRNVLLSCFLSSFVFGVLTLYANRKIGFYVLIFVLFLCPVLIALMYGLLSEYIEAVLYIRIDAVGSRTEQYLYAIRAISENFFTGVGSEASQVSQGYSVHNMFLNAMMRAGIGGVAYTLVIFVTAYRLFEKSPHSVFNRLMAAAFFGFLCAGMFFPAISSSSPIVWSTLGIFIAFSFEREKHLKLNTL